MMTRVRKLAQLCNSRDPTVQTRLTQVLPDIRKSVQVRNQEAEFFYSLGLEHRKKDDKSSLPIFSLWYSPRFYTRVLRDEKQQENKMLHRIAHWTLFSVLLTQMFSCWHYF
jgi:hypothetical protein